MESKRASSSLREPWFLVACCPTNVARTLASLAAYLATADDGGIQIHQYADSRIATTLGDGRRVGVEVATGYPDDGTVHGARHRDRRAAVGAHAAGAAVGDGAELADADGRRPVGPGHGRRRTAVRRRRRGHPDAAADAALDAARSADRRRSRLRRRRARTAGAVRRVGRPARTSATSTCSASTRRCRRAIATAQWSSPPGSSIPPDGVAVPRRPTAAPSRSADDVDVPLVPYNRWANRGPSTMRVWLPTV